MACDALLERACWEIEVPYRLAVLPEGIDRDLERLRIE